MYAIPKSFAIWRSGASHLLATAMNVPASAWLVVTLVWLRPGLGLVQVAVSHMPRMLIAMLLFWPAGGAE